MFYMAIRSTATNEWSLDFPHFRLEGPHSAFLRVVPVTQSLTTENPWTSPKAFYWEKTRDRYGSMGPWYIYPHGSMFLIFYVKWVGKNIAWIPWIQSGWVLKLSAQSDSPISAPPEKSGCFWWWYIFRCTHFTTEPTGGFTTPINWRWRRNIP